MPILLREYQQAAIDAVRNMDRAGQCRCIINLPTGAGKTLTAMHMVAQCVANGHRCAWLAHRDELISQARDAFVSLAPEHALKTGIVKAERNEVGAQLVFASLQTLWQEKRREQFFGVRPEFTLVIADECFPAGTMIGDRPIETVRVGDTVPSFDERTWRTVTRRVTRTFTSKPSGLVRVYVGGASIACTPGHPFLTSRGWVPAIALDCSDVVCYTTRHDHRTSSMDAMRPLRRAGVQEAATRWELLRTMQGSPTRRAREEGHDAVPHLRETRGVHGAEREGCDQEGARLLLSAMQDGVLQQGLVRDDGPHESKVRIGANEGSESDAASFGPREAEDNASRNGMETSVSGRQRKTNPGPATTPRMCSRVEYGDPDTNGSLPRQKRVSDVLQSGHRGTDAQDRNRSGRRISHGNRSPETGQKERGVPAFARVDRVEVLEPGRDGTFGEVCPGGLVYNLEVEETHTYLAGGFVAHNCHHYTSAETLKIMQMVPADAALVGLTATVERGDGGNLGSVFTSGIAYQLPLLVAIRDGYLVPFEPRPIKIDCLDLSNVGTVAGDYNQGELGEAMEEDDVVRATAEAIVANAAERKSLVFTVTIAQATKTRDELATRGIQSRVVSGDTPADERRAILRDFRSGAIRAIANCNVLTEGYDEPSADCVVIARPTRSKTLFLQMIGRGLRTTPGKKNCIVLDLMGATARHSPIQAAALIDEMEREAQMLRMHAAGCAPPCSAPRCRCWCHKIHDGAQGMLRPDWTPPDWAHWVTINDDGAVAATTPGLNVIVWRESPSDDNPTDDNPNVWRCTAWRKGRGRIDLTPAPVWLDLARGIGEDVLRRAGGAKIAKKEAGWRDRPASEGQISALQKWHAVAPDLDVLNLTRGEAADLLTKAISGMQWKKLRKGRDTSRVLAFADAAELDAIVEADEWKPKGEEEPPF